MLGTEKWGRHFAYVILHFFLNFRNLKNIKMCGWFNFMGNAAGK